MAFLIFLSFLFEASLPCGAKATKTIKTTTKMIQAVVFLIFALKTKDEVRETEVR